MKFQRANIWVNGEVLRVCNEYHYYTCGTREEFVEILDKVSDNRFNPTDEIIIEVAQDIYNHSKHGSLDVSGVGEILDTLLNETIRYQLLPIEAFD